MHTEFYNATRGIELLEHLGLGNLSDLERRAFCEGWDEVYGRNEGHFLSAVCELYSMLPFRCARGVVDEEIRKEREYGFTERVNSVRLKDWMHE